MYSNLFVETMYHLSNDELKSSFYFTKMVINLELDWGAQKDITIYEVFKSILRCVHAVVNPSQFLQ